MNIIYGPSLCDLSYDLHAKQEVKILQRLLNSSGYPCGSVDGKYGNRTMQSIKDVQKDSGLSVTGKCDLKTWQAIFNL